MMRISSKPGWTVFLIVFLSGCPNNGMWGEKWVRTEPAIPIPADPVIATPEVSSPSTPPPTRIWKLEGGRQAWVLVVGIQKYKTKDIPTLPYAKMDAEKVRQWFIERAGLPKANVHALLNEEATRKNLMDKIDWLRKTAQPTDAVFVYFSCHGAPELAINGSGYNAKYLVLYDTDPVHLYSTGFPLDDLNNKMDGIKASTQVVILESCYAGPVGKEVMKGASTADLVIRSTAIKQMGKTGRIILTASSGRQVALGLPDKGGVFTHFLLETWGNGKKRLLTTCFDEIRDKVSREITKTGSTQEPQKYGAKNIDILLAQ
jgi:hypothetical protein